VTGPGRVGLRLHGGDRASEHQGGQQAALRGKQSDRHGDLAFGVWGDYRDKSIVSSGARLRCIPVVAFFIE